MSQTWEIPPLTISEDIKGGLSCKFAKTLKDRHFTEHSGTGLKFSITICKSSKLSSHSLLKNISKMSVSDLNKWGSEFSSYKIVLRNRVTQNDVTLRVTNSKKFTEIPLSSY